MVYICVCGGRGRGVFDLRDRSDGEVVVDSSYSVSTGGWRQVWVDRMLSYGDGYE